MQDNHAAWTTEEASSNCWPPASEHAARPMVAVTLEQHGSVLRIVRELSCDDEVVARVIAWSREYDEPQQAIDAYEALSARQADLIYWSVGSQALGREWLTPIMAEVVAGFVSDRDEARVRAAAEENKALEEAARELEEANEISAYFRERKGSFHIDLDRGSDTEKRVWSIGFDESWERDRFWDWLCWHTERFEEFAGYLEEATRLDLERKLLREMLVTEQTVKKQGLGSGGRRPLRFWRGEL